MHVKKQEEDIKTRPPTSVLFRIKLWIYVFMKAFWRHDPQRTKEPFCRLASGLQTKVCLRPTNI